jgi:hypothetical protein
MLMYLETIHIVNGNNYLANFLINPLIYSPPKLKAIYDSHWMISGFTRYRDYYPNYY